MIRKKNSTDIYQTSKLCTLWLCLKLDNIFQKDYDKKLEVYKKLNCKNIKEYLDIYLKLNICLQSDIFNVFRKTIWDKFEIDIKLGIKL